MHILVVEDEIKISRFIGRGLKEAGYCVTTAFDGEEGLFLAESHPFDLILLDIMLPKRDGLDVCRALRKQGKSVPIIMLTAKDSIDNRVQGLDNGANDYLTKPFAFEELLARIRSQLRTPKQTSPNHLHVGALHIDLLKHLATENDTIINLSSKEFSVLEYFMRKPDMVVTRTELAEHVWDMHFEPETNVIDVTLTHLRKKLSSSTCLETIRGRGYRLNSTC